MPHKYKRKEGAKPREPIDSDAMKNAVAAVKAGGTYKGTAKAFKVPLMTLKRLCRKLGEDNTNKSCTPDYKKSQVFTKEEEEELTEYLLMASRLYYGLTNNNTKTLAYQYAKMNRKSYPKNWDRNEAAGSDWLRGFMERNPVLSLRTPEATSLSRSTSFNKHTVGVFFDKLREVLAREQFPPSSIWNVDESGLTTVHKPGKIIAEKGVKQVGKVTSGERGSLVTICVAVNASGNHIPPFLIFPRVNWQDRMLHGAPPETSGCTHPSGWMTAASFLLFLKHFVKYTKCSVEDKQLLIMDNHDSHISVDGVNYAKNNGTVLLTIPPHTSHKLQPLDRSLFGPLKKYYNTAAADWMLMNPGKTITIYEVAGLLGIAFPQAVTPKNIMSGFISSGIWPLNSNIFTDDEFLTSYVTDRPNPVKEPLPLVENSVASSSEISGQTTPTKLPKAKEHFTPEEIRPFPKAPPRIAQSARGRKRGSSRILTDTPEKNKIENVIAKTKKRRPMKKYRNATCVKKIALDVTDSSSEELEKISLHDSSDDNDFYESSSSPEDNEPSEKLKVNDFVIVRFSTKKTVKHFVGKVEKIIWPDSEVEVNFLKKKEGSYQFYFPEQIDKSVVNVEDCVTKLPQPSILPGTLRTAGLKTFKFDLSSFFL